MHNSTKPNTTDKPIYGVHILRFYFIKGALYFKTNHDSPETAFIHMVAFFGSVDLIQLNGLTCQMYIGYYIAEIHTIAGMDGLRITGALRGLPFQM